MKKKTTTARRSRASTTAAATAAAAAAAAHPARTLSKLSARERQEVLAALIYASKKGVGWSNCWAFALDIVTPGTERYIKLQPGHLAGDDTPVRLRDCSDLRRRALADKRVTPKAPNKPCPRGTHEIAAFIAPGQDFHWYRKDRDVVVHTRPGHTVSSLATLFGTKPRNVRLLPALRLAIVRNANMWTHKPGTTSVRATDSCGKAIRDPDKACRRSDDFSYTMPCGHFCAKSPPRRLPVTLVPADVQRASAEAVRLEAANISNLAASLSRAVR